MMSCKQQLFHTRRSSAFVLPLCCFAALVGNLLFLKSTTLTLSSQPPVLPAHATTGDMDLANTNVDRDYRTLEVTEDESTGEDKESKPEPDGFFQGHPVYHRGAGMNASSSHVHCVGDNYDANSSWIRKSCSFRHLCFDLDQKDYVLFQTPLQQKIASRRKAKANHTLTTLSSDMSSDSNSVALGSLNKKWNMDADGIPRLEWFPRIVTLGNKTSDANNYYATNGYYELPDNVVLIPYHAFAGFNPGHLVWDDFLPIYTLLRIFGLLGTSTSRTANNLLLPIRHILEDEPLWATCNSLPKECQEMYDKFAPLLMGTATTTTTTSTTPNMKIATTHNVSLVEKGLPTNIETRRKEKRRRPARSATKIETKPQPQLPRRSNLVCAKHAAAGIGFLSDHGMKEHGWEPEDYEVVHNLGRGSLLYDFRNFMMRNIGIDPEPEHTTSNNNIEKKQARIVFSMAWSESRDFDLTEHISATKKAFPDAMLQEVVWKNMSLHDQVHLMSETSIFVSGAGGSAVTATFLPRGASMILFYDEEGGDQYGVSIDLPARLDWDIFNNMGYIRAHWLPGMKLINHDVPLFVDLIRQELETQEHFF